MEAHDNLDQLPVDSDIEVDDTPQGAARPLHFRWRYLGLVALGGAIGTGAREALTLTWPTPADAFPLTIFGINIVGAFLLGVLLEFLTRRGRDEGHRRTLRLLCGTGALGGFTTYSSFATDTAPLAGTAIWIAFGYAAATLLAGLLSSLVGVAVGSLLHRRRSTEDPV